MKNKKYVVVDLETTGTSRQDNDRIIQFAAVVIENWQIQDQIAFLVNPEQPITQRISNLTGITNKQLRQQAVFQEHAQAIFELLKDATFVAHNVNFDLPFLQSELTAANLPQLNCAAIDTVELAQVLLPQAPSFKLVDLTHYLKIDHLAPHQADSDALATAILFLKLREHLLNLPAPTLRWLVKEAPNFLRQTGDFITQMAQPLLNTEQSLPDNLVVSHQIVLQKPLAMSESLLSKASFPVTKKQKLALFNEQLQWRPQQAKLMNFVQRKLTQETPLALVDAPTGLGKTLGYLLPVSYQLDQGQKIVVATSTKLLQQQILTKDWPQIEQLRQRHYEVAQLSSAQDYLDLDNFYQLLTRTTKSRQTKLLLLKILVWLTQTTSGNLQELNITNDQTEIFRLLRSSGHRTSGLFMEYDFWQRQLQTARHSSLIVTNQNYLLRHLDLDVWQTAQSVIIDEAANLLQQTLQPQAQFNLAATQTALKHLSDLLYQNRVLLRQFFQQNRRQSWRYTNLAEFEQKFVALTANLQRVSADLMTNYVKQKLTLQQRSGRVQLGFAHAEIKAATITYLKQCSQALQALLAVVWPLLQLYQATKHNSLIVVDRLLQQITNEYLLLQQQLQQLELINQQLTNRQAGGIIITMLDYHNWNSLTLATQVFNQRAVMAALKDQFATVILLGAGLKYQHSFHNFLQQLGYPAAIAQKNKLSLQADFPLAPRLKVYLPSDASSPTMTNFAETLGQQLVTLLRSQTTQTLILFNSLQTLQTVYQAVQLSGLTDEREVLAQSITGSNRRLQKRFALNPTAILLATTSFGTGLNLAPQHLKLVIITQLPFEAPDDPFVKAKNQYWHRQGRNAFQVESLPTTVRRLKQQVGRLIRGPQDQGTLIFLDQRLQTAHYGKLIYQELDLPLLRTDLTVAQISQQLSVVKK